MTSEPAYEPSAADRPRPRTARRLLGIALGLTALVALVAAASRGRRSPPGGRGGGPSDSLLDYVTSAYLVIGTLVFVVIVFLLARDRETLTARKRVSTVRQLIQFGAAIVTLLLLFGSGTGRQLLERLRAGLEPGEPPAPLVQGERAERRERTRPEEVREARFRWEPAIVIAAAAAAGAAVYLARRSRRREGSWENEMAEAMAAVLDDALADLRAEADPRRAIIAAYARMERLLAAYGVPRDPAEAPFEYLGRVLVELRASAGSVFELTALFERAKFSQHAVDAGMKEEAIAALAAVRDELREPQIGTEPQPEPT